MFSIFLIKKLRLTLFYLYICPSLGFFISSGNITVSKVVFLNKFVEHCYQYVNHLNCVYWNSPEFDRTHVVFDFFEVMNRFEDTHVDSCTHQCLTHFENSFLTNLVTLSDMVNDKWN